MNERAVGIIAIIVKERENTAQKVNEILADFGEMVVGRLGLPYQERKLHIITLIVDASNDRIGALTGKLGQIPGITVKSTLAKL
ncbi:MAG TPA: TM1266 family iron-only hydrogenase system putative regulator [Treponemataceae bacterium]|nr:TM1266 family iron-only hydrogenase system putative regulator [Treponemataceae bacterium]